METIVNSNKEFLFLSINQNYDVNIKYRRIKYIVELKYKNNILLLNSLTGEVVFLTNAEYRSLNKPSNIALYDLLVNKLFFVPIDFDEKKIANQVLSVISNIKKNEFYNSFTLMTTLDCNARCYYCFEHGSKRYPMTKKTASDVADFLIKKGKIANSKNKKIRLLWFGGEPLFNIDAIDIITKKLNENNINYKSSMISNGYLFDDEIIKRAKNTWNLKHVQITLDGTEEIYNKTKAYIYNTKISPFRIVINNIKSLLENNIRVHIRLNLGNHNSDDLKILIEYLCDEFKGYENLLSIYVWLLYDNRGSVKNIKTDMERHELTEELIKLENYIYEQGFGTKSLPPQKMKLNMCIADSNNSLTILPDGNIGKCDHYTDSMLIGDIYSDKFDEKMIKRWKERRPEVELCDSCPLYPQCIKLTNCPELGEYDCDTYEQKRLISKLHMQMKNAYDKYISDNQ